jgi:hypothetical protein
VFAADFETDLTAADLTGGLAADILFLADVDAALGTALTAGFEAGLAVGLATGLELVLADTEADLELDFAVGLTAALGLGDAAAMVFLMPTDRVISVLFCMECAC